MKKILVLLVCLSIFLGLKAQTYVPIDTANTSTRKIEADKYVSDSKSYLEANKVNFTSGERSFVKKKYNLMNKEIKDEMLKGQYMFDARFDSLITQLADRIIQSNPSISKDIKFYVKRNLSLNATSLGNSRFVLNMGCFYYLQNEEQLASVISHEIAHFIRRHEEQDMRDQYALEHSSELENEVELIGKQKQNKGDIATNKMKTLLYEKGAKNKRQEFEADSIGYVIFRNSKFHSCEYIKALRLLAQYDTLHPKGLGIDVYKQFFDLPTQPFKNEWLKKEDFSSYDYSKFKEKYNQDSLKSHPETELRISRLCKLFPEIESQEQVSPTKTFLKLSEIAEFERPPSLYIQEMYGAGLYLCLLRLQENPTDRYQKKWMGEFLAKIAKARKEYTLNRYLERIEPKDQSESYQQYLNFMWNLSLSELTRIAEYYTKKDS